MKSEVWYEWKVEDVGTDEKETRLFTPLSDPHKYEYPADGIFESQEEARKYLVDWGYLDVAREQGWVLCFKMITVVGGVDP